MVLSVLWLNYFRQSWFLLILRIVKYGFYLYKYKFIYTGWASLIWKSKIQNAPKRKLFWAPTWHSKEMFIGAFQILDFQIRDALTSKYIANIPKSEIQNTFGPKHFWWGILSLVILMQYFVDMILVGNNYKYANQTLNLVFKAGYNSTVAPGQRWFFHNFFVQDILICQKEEFLQRKQSNVKTNSQNPKL